MAPSSTKPELKAVLDVNVWVSALLWGGKPAQIVNAAEQNKVRLFVSESIIAETSQVLNYPKLKKAYQSEGLRPEQLIEAVLRVAKFAKAESKVRVVLEHPADDKFIECAIDAKADYVVSGDRHLLKVGKYRRIQIVSVNDFLQILQAVG